MQLRVMRLMYKREFTMLDVRCLMRMNNRERKIQVLKECILMNGWKIRVPTKKS